MSSHEIQLGKTLAEVLRLQRWAGGEAVPPDRIFGLMHGFETVLEQERSCRIRRETQDKVEHLLEDVEAGKQSTDGPAIKDRLHEAGVSEPDARKVMQLCVLQSRFLEGVEKVVSGRGSVFEHLRSWRSPETGWYGALHYMELVDLTEGVRKKMHAVFAPCVPRVGEVIEPEGGSRMKVLQVEHVVAKQRNSRADAMVCLVPHVLLEAIDPERDQGR